MKLEYSFDKLESIFAITNSLQKDEGSFSTKTGINKILWNRNDEPVTIVVDDIKITLLPNQIITTTFFHHINFTRQDLPLTAFLFNREFYCIIDHDSEVGCNGILFFGTQNLPVISIPEEEKRKFELLWEVLLEEFKTKDNIQGEMLQMLLKRLIIICTRLAKEQLTSKELKNSQIEAIRQFNFLVDIHFRTKKKVKEYAGLMYKSPKTLSNLFATYNQKSPQQIIQERVVLEAKRLLLFTDKRTQEIAFDLGFDDPAHFSRYFKKIAKLSPSEYKENHSLTN